MEQTYLRTDWSKIAATDAERTLLTAVQKSIWKADIILPTDTDWNAVMKEAEAQAILGIVAPVAPKETQREWIGKTSTVTAAFVRILHYQAELCTLLEQNDISYVILKGTAAAIYYPDPSQRSMGDIDFFVPAEHFERAIELLRTDGYRVDNDSAYARHADIDKDGISFEMHRFFSDDAFSGVDYYIMDGLKRAEKKQVFGSTFCMLPATENGLVLISHVAHHLKESLGIRQVMDWMLYVENELDDTEWDRSFSQATRRIGLNKLAVTVTRMCQMYLGLAQRITWCGNADEELCTELMNSILRSGNFGKKNGAGTAVEKTITHLKKGGFRYLQTAGEYNWKAYRKHKWLKPIAWAYQLCRYVKQGFQTKRNRKQIMQDFERGKQRSSMLKKLEIESKD